MNSLRHLRSLAASTKKMLLYRPIGLARLGSNSALFRPRSLYGRGYISIGNDTTMMSNCRIEAISHYAHRDYSPLISIGSNVYIGRYFFLTAIREVSIGDGCVFSDYVYIADSSHGLDPTKGLIMLQELETKGPVIIGAHCFLGYRVTVMPGVTLGERCIVGANSVVTRSFPAYSMIAGSPARVLKRYSHERLRWE